MPILFGIVAGCSDFPRDSAGTLEDVRHRRFTLGWSEESRGDPRFLALIEEIGARTNSRPVFVEGEAERLLSLVEKGDLDLVLGSFDRKSPWAKRVTFSKPLFSSPDGAFEGKAALRNGEHAWSTTVDRAVKASKS